MASQEVQKLVMEMVNNVKPKVDEMVQSMNQLKNSIDSNVNQINQSLSRIDLSAGFKRAMGRIQSELRTTLQTMVSEVKKATETMRSALNNTPSATDALSKATGGGSRGGRNNSPGKAKDVANEIKNEMAEMRKALALTEQLAKLRSQVVGNYITPRQISRKFGGLDNIIEDSEPIKMAIERAKIKLRQRVDMIKEQSRDFKKASDETTKELNKIRNYVLAMEQNTANMSRVSIGAGIGWTVQQKFLNDFISQSNAILQKRLRLAQSGTTSWGYDGKRDVSFNVSTQQFASYEAMMKKYTGGLDKRNGIAGTQSMLMAQFLAKNLPGAMQSDFDLSFKEAIIKQSKEMQAKRSRVNNRYAEMSTTSQKQIDLSPLKNEYAALYKSQYGLNSSALSMKAMRSAGDGTPPDNPSKLKEYIDVLRAKELQSEYLQQVKDKMLEVKDAVVTLGSSVRDMLSTAFSNLGMIFKGFLGIFGMGAAAFGGMTVAVKNFGADIINATEQIRGIEIALYGLVKTKTGVQDLLNTALKASEEMPISYENVLNLTKSLALITPLRPMLSDTEKLEGNFKKLEKIVIGLSQIEPEWGIAGAVFSLREALSGDLLSLKRRFEIPVNLITTVDGQKLTAVKNNPEKVIEALNKYIGEFYSEEMLKETSKQFGMIWSKMIGNISQAKMEIGKAGFYDIIVEDMLKLQKLMSDFTKSADFKQFAQRVSGALSNVWKDALKMGKGGFNFLSAMFGSNIAIGDTSKISELAASGLEKYALAFKKLSNIANDEGIRKGIIDFLNYGKDTVIALSKTVYHEIVRIMRYADEFIGFLMKVVDKGAQLFGSTDPDIKTKGVFYLWLFGPGNVLRAGMSALNIALMTINATAAKLALTFVAIPSAVYVAVKGIALVKNSIDYIYSMTGNGPKDQLKKDQTELISGIRSSGLLTRQDYSPDITEDDIKYWGTEKSKLYSRYKSESLGNVVPEQKVTFNALDKLIGGFNKKNLEQESLKANLELFNEEYSPTGKFGRKYEEFAESVAQMAMGGVDTVADAFIEAARSNIGSKKGNPSIQALSSYFASGNVFAAQNMPESNVSKMSAFIGALDEQGLKGNVITALANGKHFKGAYSHGDGYAADVDSAALDPSKLTIADIQRINNAAIASDVKQVTLEGNGYLKFAQAIEEFSKTTNDMRVKVAGNNALTTGSHLHIQIAGNRSTASSSYDEQKASAGGLFGRMRDIWNQDNSGELKATLKEQQAKAQQKVIKDVFEVFHFPKTLDNRVMKSLDEALGDLKTNVANEITEANSKFTNGTFGAALYKKMIEASEIEINRSRQPGKTMAYPYANTMLRMAGMSNIPGLETTISKQMETEEFIGEDRVNKMRQYAKEQATEAMQVSLVQARESLPDSALSMFGMLKDTSITHNAQILRDAFLVISRTEMDPELSTFFSNGFNFEPMKTGLIKMDGDLEGLISQMKDISSEYYKNMSGEGLKKAYAANQRMIRALESSTVSTWMNNAKALKQYNDVLQQYKMQLDSISMSEAKSAVPVLLGAKTREQASASSSALRDRFTKGLETPINDVFNIGFKNSVLQMKTYGEIVLDWSENLATDMMGMFENNFFDVMTGKISNLGDMFRSIGDAIKNSILKIISQLASRFVIDIILNATGQSSGGGNVFTNILQQATGGSGGGNGGSGGILDTVFSLFNSGKGNSGGSSGAASSVVGAAMKSLAGGSGGGSGWGGLATGAASSVATKALTGSKSLTSVLGGAWKNIKTFLTNPATSWIAPVAAVGAFLSQPGRLFGGTKDHTGEAREAQAASMSSWNDYVASRGKYGRDYYASGMSGDIMKYNFPQGQYSETESGSKWNPFDGAYTVTGHFDDSAFQGSIYGYYKLLDKAAESHFNKLHEIEKMKEKDAIKGATAELAVKQEYFNIIEKQYKDALKSGDWTTTNDLRDTVYQTRIELDQLNDTLKDTVKATAESRKTYDLYRASGYGTAGIYKSSVELEIEKEKGNDLVAGTQEWYDNKLAVLQKEKELHDLIYSAASDLENQIKGKREELAGLNISSAQRSASMSSFSNDYLMMYQMQTGKVPGMELGIWEGSTRKRARTATGTGQGVSQNGYDVGADGLFMGPNWVDPNTIPRPDPTPVVPTPVHIDPMVVPTTPGYVEKPYTENRVRTMGDLAKTYLMGNGYGREEIMQYVWQNYATRGRELGGYNFDVGRGYNNFKNDYSANELRTLAVKDTKIIDEEAFADYMNDKIRREMDSLKIISLTNDIADSWKQLWMSPIELQADNINKIMDKMKDADKANIEYWELNKQLNENRIAQAKDVQNMFMGGAFKATTNVSYQLNGRQQKAYGADIMKLLSADSPLSEADKQMVYETLSNYNRGYNSRKNIRNKMSGMSSRGLSMLGSTANKWNYVDYNAIVKDYGRKEFFDMQSDALSDPYMAKQVNSIISKYTTKSDIAKAYDAVGGKSAGSISDYNYGINLQEAQNAFDFAKTTKNTDLISTALEELNTVITDRAMQLSDSIDSLLNTGFIKKSDIANITMDSVDAMQQIEKLQLQARRGSFKGNIMDIASGSSLTTTELNKIMTDVAYMGDVNQFSTPLTVNGRNWGNINYGSMAQTDLTQVMGYMNTGNYKDYQDASLSYKIDQAKTRIQSLTEGNDDYYDAQSELFQLMVERAEHLKAKADESTQRMDEMLDSIDKTLKVRIAEERKSARGDIFYIDGVHFEEVINQIRERVRNQSGDTSELLETLQQATNRLSNRNLE